MNTLNVGDKIRILEDGHNGARVFEGDVLEVTTAEEWYFQTEAPRLRNIKSVWDFSYEDEFSGWEKVEEDQ